MLNPNEILDFNDLIGVPFIDNGYGFNDGGFHCWGLVWEIYRRLGIELVKNNVSCYNIPEIDEAIKKEQVRWKKVSIPSRYCVILMRINSPKIYNHLGVYIGNNRFIHCREGAGVCIDRLDSPVWKNNIRGLYEYNPCN